jgi:hypothetical protein
MLETVSHLASRGVLPTPARLALGGLPVGAALAGSAAARAPTFLASTTGDGAGSATVLGATDPSSARPTPSSCG